MTVKNVSNLAASEAASKSLIAAETIAVASLPLILEHTKPGEAREFDFLAAI